VQAVSDSLSKQHLSEVEAAWSAFKPHVTGLVKGGKVDAGALQKIITTNEKLLRLSHKLTQTIKSSKQINTTLNKVVEHSLKIADRQRMLTQKLIKERLLIFGGVDSKRNRIRMQGSVRLFENGLYGLLNGDKKRGLIRVSDEKIYNKLKEIESIWDQIQAIYRKDRINEKEMITLLRHDPIILKKSDELVKQIEHSLGL
jgi:hypothetical protein